MRNRRRLLCGLCLLGLAIAVQDHGVPAAAMPAATKTVVIVADAALPAPARHGIVVLENALRAKQIAVSEDSSQLAAADAVVLADLAPSAGAQSLTIRKGARYRNKPALALTGGDAVGLMYAALDTADRVGWSAGGDPFELIRDTSESPYLDRRGVVMFTMNRAYFES